ncbi:hypothetical protein HRR99_14945 [Agrobacterium vaccinii]|uniref:hypothetical protein n=1 Tax=Agrobacterium vaccinii TaxID=2735528 RepID=UPI000DD0623E|nr:hypothetical protein [Agrobacterium vaccinii]UHS57947.1 hypothetical protein HRS00_14580 [Agrobacterium vaccinii]UHS62728.1 hypothetical protein HRR99_14945 [Agrobacterium vaccinii]
MAPYKAIFTRRQSFQLAGLAAFALGTKQAAAAPSPLTFDEMYGKIGVLGLEFSEKLKALTGKEIRMKGFMAPPLKAEAAFFVLTEIPMALCPFCSSDSDWPDNIVVVYLSEKQTFVQPSTTIEVTGMLERGSWTDPETGFVSLVRIRDAQYRVS